MRFANLSYTPSINVLDTTAELIQVVYFLQQRGIIDRISRGWNSEVENVVGKEVDLAEATVAVKPVPKINELGAEVASE